MHSPFLFSSAIPPYFTVILRLPPAKSKLFRPIKFDKKRRLLLFTHVCPATGFCRCYAFQIGKICCQNCIVRNFQFRKFLPVNSYYNSTICFVKKYFAAPTADASFLYEQFFKYETSCSKPLYAITFSPSGII